jgi:hypothetical protein
MLHNARVHEPLRHRSALLSNYHKITKRTDLRKSAASNGLNTLLAVWLVADFEALSYQVTTAFDTCCVARIPIAPAINYTACCAP